jgi:hypothetical protein
MGCSVSCALVVESDPYQGLGWYLLAKVLEVGMIDQGIFRMGEVVSGHTLKHLAAALGAYWLYRMVKNRRPVATSQERTHQPGQILHHLTTD